MDDETSWQDAAPASTDMLLIGPTKPDALPPELDYEPGDDDAGDFAPEAFDDLETGIASIFAALHAAGDGDASADDDDPDDGLAEAHTFQLLGELDRLWQRPSP